MSLGVYLAYLAYILARTNRFLSHMGLCTHSRWGEVLCEHWGLWRSGHMHREVGAELCMKYSMSSVGSIIWSWGEGTRSWEWAGTGGCWLEGERKMEVGNEELRERAEEWRWWVHVWARGCWSIPGSAFPDRLNGKGQRVSFPMKEGLSEMRLVRLEHAYVCTCKQTVRCVCNLKQESKFYRTFETTICHQILQRNCSQGPYLHKMELAVWLYEQAKVTGLMFVFVQPSKWRLCEMRKRKGEGSGRKYKATMAAPLPHLGLELMTLWWMSS